MYKTIRIFLLVLVTLTTVANMAHAQKMLIRMGDKAFLDFAYKEAADYYYLAFQRDSTNAHVVRRLADTYRNIGNTEESEKWHRKLVDMNEFSPEYLYHFSMALTSNGKYEEAQEMLEVYQKYNPADSRINEQQSIIEYIQFLLDDSVRYEIELLPFNTKGADFSPAYFEDKLVYASTGDPADNRGITYKWDELPYLDLYYVSVDEYGNFSEPAIFAEEIMSSFHEGPASFYKNRMYYNGNRTNKSVARDDEENNVQIFIADYENAEWIEKGGFEHNNISFNIRNPSISNDGKVLYFASDMNGGFGKYDIYWCKKVNGKWGAPMNLGPKVNTEGNEDYPFIAPDGVLYFSSNGRGGMGGLDIFMAIPDRDVFTKVDNMGYPVNSSKDDFGIILDEVGMNGYFSSNRSGGVGYDDIYRLEILWIPVQIRGVVRDRINTYEVSGVKVALLDENLDTVSVAYTKEDGEFLFDAYKQRNYRLAISKEDYIPNEKDISTYNKLPNQQVEVVMFIEMDFDNLEDPDQLEPLSLEVVDGQELQIIQIEHINYDLARHTIRPDAKQILDKVIELIHQYPDLEVIIESHTDARGSDEYNLLLSKRRARSAYDYLVSQNIDGEKIDYAGYGETQLLNQCDDGFDCTEQEHAINRRSIIKVIRRGKYKTKRSTRSIFYF